MTDRTLFNHLAQVTAFLKLQGIADLVIAYDKPRYDEKLVSAYGRTSFVLCSRGPPTN